MNWRLFRASFAPLLIAAALWGADISGKWKGTAVSNDGYTLVLLFLRQKGAEVKGSGGPDGSNQSPLENGKIADKRITFDITPPGRTPLHFELTTSGAELTGTVKVKHNGQVVTSTVSLHRAD